MARSLALLILFSFSVSYAQDARGRISGSVNDGTGVVIPGAAVVAVKDDTGVRFETQASTEGAYELPLLPPGTYSIEVKATGFKRYARELFAVRAGNG